MSVAWITGARGFIGRHLAQRLAKKGISVAGVGHGAWSNEETLHWGVKDWINGDIAQSNFDRLADMTGLPDMIFHLAGGSAVGLSLQMPEEDFRRTLDSSVQLLEWARNHSAQTRLVLASSAAVYGAEHSKPIRETDSIIPYSPYGYHKRMAELLFESYSRNFGLLTAVVRLFSVYGQELRKQLLWDLCNRFKEKPTTMVMAGSGLERRDWLHVNDAAEYLKQAATLSDAQCFVVNGGRGIAVSVREIAECTRDAWGLETVIEFSGVSRSGDPQYLVADTTLGKTAGFSCHLDWSAGIKEYVTWFQQTRSRLS